MSKEVQYGDYLCMEEDDGIIVTGYIGDESVVKLPDDINSKPIIGVGCTDSTYYELKLPTPKQPLKPHYTLTNAT